MVRSLWTAASGMRAQQNTVDTISNNIANVNTTGYRKDRMEFKSLLYQTIQTETTSANGETKPVGAQVGVGVRTAAITTDFDQGALTASTGDFDMGINGKGFFAVRGSDGETYYTRNGAFSFNTGGNGLILTDSNGYPVLDTQGNTITYNAQYNVSNIVVDEYGNLAYSGENGAVDLNQQIALYQFSNPAGLDKSGGTMYQETEVSGQPMLEETTPGVQRSKVLQGYLEASNVQIVDEMVDLIVAQRAYEMNSKTIQAADDMLSQANSLKR